VALATTPARGRVIIRLSHEDGMAARVVGLRRYQQAVEEARADTLGQDSLTNHVLGAAGECAFARFLGIEWDRSVGTFKTRPDVGGFEVRTARGLTSHLIIRPNDIAERKNALVCYERGTYLFVIVGWMRAADAQQPQWWRTAPPPAWWVPQSALHPFTDRPGA
jgi:hypothetical protein